MHQILFEFEYTLCKEYPALSPWEIEQRKFKEVIRLIADTRTVQIGAKKTADPDHVIRRRAGDNWF